MKRSAISAVILSLGALMMTLPALAMDSDVIQKINMEISQPLAPEHAAMSTETVRHDDLTHSRKSTK